jgi:hypothetical protein
LNASHGIKQIESITWLKKKIVEGIIWYEQFEDITWYTTVGGYHMA